MVNDWSCQNNAEDGAVPSGQRKTPRRTALVGPVENPRGRDTAAPRTAPELLRNCSGDRWKRRRFFSIADCSEASGKRRRARTDWVRNMNLIIIIIIDANGQIEWSEQRNSWNQLKPPFGLFLSFVTVAVFEVTVSNSFDFLPLGNQCGNAVMGAIESADRLIHFEFQVDIFQFEWIAVVQFSSDFRALPVPLMLNAWIELTKHQKR